MCDKPPIIFLTFASQETACKFPFTVSMFIWKFNLLTSQDDPHSPLIQRLHTPTQNTPAHSQRRLFALGHLLRM